MYNQNGKIIAGIFILLFELCAHDKCISPLQKFDC
jgi:hypothetical protein